MIVNPFSASLKIGHVQKFFLENLYLASFLCWRDMSRDPFFLREDFELFLMYEWKNWKIKSEMRYLDKWP